MTACCGPGLPIGWQYDANADGQLEPSEQFHFMYDDRWRILATFRGFDENPKEAFVYHAAGHAGMGDSSYVDSVILRDRDASTAWTNQATTTLNERRYGDTQRPRWHASEAYTRTPSSSILKNASSATTTEAKTCTMCSRNCAETTRSASHDP